LKELWLFETSESSRPALHPKRPESPTLYLDTVGVNWNVQRNRYNRLTESKDLRGDVTGKAGKVRPAAATTKDSDSDVVSSTN